MNLQMDVFQVDERGFYVRIVSKKGKGVAVFLYKAIQSLTRVNVQSSNLATDAENYVLTFTFHVSILFYEGFYSRCFSIISSSF